jgi:hypothetical protein
MDRICIARSQRRRELAIAAADVDDQPALNSSGFQYPRRLAI